MKKKHYFREILLLAMLALTSTPFVVSCTKSSALQRTVAESLGDRVLRSGKIRCAYGIYPPYCIKDPNSGKLSGIGIDALSLIAKKLGLKLVYLEEVGWGNMVEGLQTNRYDIMAMPVWTNTDRAKVAFFSKPLCYNPIFAYARKGDKRFSKLENLNSNHITISTVDGETANVIAQTDFPKAKRLSMPQFTDISQNFLNLVSKKADIVLIEPDLAEKFLKNNPGTIENINPKRPIRVFPVCWMFKRGETEFKSMLDIVLDEVIYSGEMERIIHKYQPAPGSVFPVIKPYQTIR